MYILKIKVLLPLGTVHMVYGGLAYKDNLLQVSAGRPAPTIGSSELCICV